MIDYRQLLKDYMAEVIAQEGWSYLIAPASLSGESLDELRKIEQELEVGE